MSAAVCSPMSVAAPLPQESPAHLAAMQALLGMPAAATVPQTAAAVGQSKVEEPEARLWFVRIPKRAASDGQTRQLREQFDQHVEIVRKINARLGAKREVIKGLRAQMTEVRSVKGASQPEFDDKLNRLKQLREQRNACQTRISDIRGLVKGLDCKTEKELDSRMQQEEEKIRFGGANLREEKQVLAALSKLRAQRERIKAYEQQQGQLVELEAELAKVKAQIDSQEDEFNMVKVERDAASKVATGLYAKLKAVEQELEAELVQQKEAVDKKDKVLAQLEAAKQEASASQGDYADNRKFSLSVREMVDAGQLDEAREACAQQTNEMIEKLLTNRAMWEEYCKAMAEQRKSFVSDLLPESSTAAKAAAAAAAEVQVAEAAEAKAKALPAKKAGSGKAVAAAPAAAAQPKPVPVADGTGKAKDLIASIMLQARAEAARAAKVNDAASELGSEGTSEDNSSEEKSKAPAPAPAAAKPVEPAEAPKFVSNAAAKAAEVFNFKMEVPKVADVEMLPLPARVEKVERSKDEVRDEQRLKAAEAEARKQQRQEAKKAKKAKVASARSKAEEEERLAKAAAAAAEAEAAAAAEAAAKAAAAEAAAVVQAHPTPAAEADVPAGKADKVKGPKSALALTVEKLAPPAAKRPAAKASLVRDLKKFYLEHQALMVLVACLVLFVAMLLVASV